MERKEYHKLKMREYRAKNTKYREYDRRYARLYRRAKGKTKIKKSFEFQVKGLVLLRKSDKTILVEPLNIRSNLQNQRILELSGFD